MKKVVKKKAKRRVIVRRGRVAEEDRRGALDPDIRRAVETAPSIPSNIQMQMDTFNVIHARIALNDGLTPLGDPSEVREKIFGIVAKHGWETTMALLASCARLFAEVPSPFPPLSTVTKEFLHQLARDLDARRQPMRHVDTEATKGHKT